MRILTASLMAVGLCGVLAAASAARAPHDRIVVLGHFPLTGGPVQRLLPARHYSRDFLYAEQRDGTLLTVLDTTDPAAPFRVAGVTYPPDEDFGEMVTTAGTAALIASPAAAPAEGFPETVRIVSFADPAHPKVHRTFTGVTAVGRDNARGLIFLADGDGIWILARRPAEDPAVERAYARHIMYDH